MFWILNILKYNSPVRFINQTMKYICYLSLLLFFCGCALQTGLSTSDRLRLLDQYLSKHEFDNAFALIADSSSDKSNEAELEKERKIIADQLQLFEKKTIAAALKLEQKEDWTGARQKYSTALVTASTSTDLQKAEQKMILRFKGKMKALRDEELIVTGECLQKRLPLLRTQHISDPEDIGVKWSFLRLEENAKEIGRELLQLGGQMLAENNLDMARRTIPLGYELAPGVESEELNVRLSNILKGRKKRTQKKQKKVTQDKDSKNITEFNNAMAHGNLLRARRSLLSLSTGTRKSMKVELMEERLDQAISGYVREEMVIGAAFYRVGEYESAIKVWKNIVVLDPENETVKNKLERARSIVENLEVLRERQNE